MRVAVIFEVDHVKLTEVCDHSPMGEERVGMKLLDLIREPPNQTDTPLLKGEDCGVIYRGYVDMSISA